MIRFRVLEGLWWLRSELSETQIFINSFYFKILKVTDVKLLFNLMVFGEFWCLIMYLNIQLNQLYFISNNYN